jgi:alpha-mannosidase
MPGCYTSVSKIKQAHADFEDNLYMTEKLCSVASLKGLIEYPEKELCEATEDLLTAEFHDVLPGTSIKAGEENGLMLFSHGKNILNKLRAKAYFALTSQEPKAKEGEYPFLVFNPNAYEWETEVECEFMLADQNWSDSIVSSFKVLDSEGNEIPAQFVKETSHLNLDWRKRLVFKAKLAPMAISRFSVFVEFVDKKEQEKEIHQGNIVYQNENTYIEISKTTGLLKSYKVDGKEYIKEEAFYLCQYDDNADPWGMADSQLDAIGTNPQRFSLMEKPDGVFAGMDSVQIIENGALRLCAEAFFKLNNSRARVEYIIHKTSGELDVKVDLFAGEINKMFRLAVPVAFEGEYRGQTAFGTQPLYMNGRECVAQRFVYVKGESNCLALFNKGTYGSKFLGSTMEMSLLRTATYCAHPICDRPLIPLDRYTQKIDLEG